MKKKKIIGFSILFSILGLMMICGSFVAYSYFSSRVVVYTDDGTTNFKIGMELNTLFDRLNSDTTATHKVSDGDNLNIVCSDTSIFETSSDYYDDVTDLGLTKTTVGDTIYYTYNPDATWGSASNPYIISEMRNLQNLYILQNNGFFDYLTGDGIRECHMPYFLVCEPDGTPVTINCTDQEFEYIGNETYPFIGYVGGAFTTTLDEETQTTEIDGKTSTQSTIYNLTVSSDEDVVDVGLFGHIGYLGDETSVSQTSDDMKFEGAVATVSDLLLYDVKVVVKEKSGWEVLADKIGDTINHIFSFTDTVTNYVESDTVPHENHHVGILAGHVEYTTINNISVYYSSDDIAAIDVQLKNKSTDGTSANFKSSSGIIGYIYHMNSFKEGGTIEIGGVNNSDVEVSGGGLGTGGGLLSGTGRGYVTAKEVYSGYDDSGNIMHYKVDGLDCYSLLVYADKARGSTDITYSLPDGSTVTVTGSESAGYTASITTTYQHYISDTEMTSTWDKIVIAYPTGTNTYDYYHLGKTKITEALSTTSSNIIEYTGLYLRLASGINAEEEYEKLCNQYVRDRIIAGTKTTDRYYFYDGVFTFALSDADDTIEETWTDGVENNLIYVGLDSDSSWTKDATGGDGAVVAFVKQVTSTTELEAARTSGKQIFIVYEDDDGNHLVTLAGNSNYVSGGGNNALLTDSTTLQFTSTTLTNKLISALNAGTMQSTISGVSATDLADGLGDGTYKALNVGAATELESTEMLKSKYGIDIDFIPNTAESTYTIDGTTYEGTAVETLNTNAKAVENTKYQTDATTATNDGLGISYFLPSSMTTTVSTDTVSSAVSTINSAIYREDWTTQITDSTITSAVSGNTAISQSETHTWDGFLAFETNSASDGSWSDRYWEGGMLYRDRYATLKIYYCTSSNSTVSKTQVGTTGKVHTNPDLFTQPYEVSGGVTYLKTEYGVNIYSYTANGKTYTGPLLFLEGSTYYSAWERENSDDIYKGTTTVTLSSGKYSITYTATYNYFLATYSAKGISYTVNGTSTAAEKTPTTTGEKVSSINGYTIPVSNGADYTLYSDGTTTGILITKYSLNGYILKSMTGSGVKYYLVGSTTSEITPGTGEPSIVNIPSTSNPLTVNYSSNTTLNVYKVGNAIGPMISNYKIDGVLTAETTSSGTIYRMYGGSVDSSLKGTAPVPLLDNSGKQIKYTVNGTSYNLYLYGGKLCILASTNKVTGYYAFSSNSSKDNTYTLRLLARRYLDGWKYSVMCSTDAYVTTDATSTFSTSNIFGQCYEVDNSTKAVVTFNTDGSCYIMYNVQSADYYLNFASSVTVSSTTYTNKFNSSSSTSSTTKMYIYTVEGTHEVSNGRIIVPTDEGEVATLSAGSYVLWPDTAESESTTYTIKQIQQSEVAMTVDSTDYLTSTTGWKASDGHTLTTEYLSKKFCMGDGISDVEIYSLWNGNISLDSDAKYVRAPVGSEGEEAYIPSGCVAFRVTQSGTTQKIRVIVAVPQTSLYVGEDGYSLSSESYYFGMWKIGTADESVTIGIDTAETWFALPKSTQYNPTTSISDANPAALTVNYKGKAYRTYLNGSKVLVAYEFTASEEGVYLLGCSQKCEIVYFSADSVASSGKDGSTSYKMGTIDFVYDNATDGNSANATKIITIDQVDSDTTDGVTTYSSYYYVSLCLLYTDNSNSVTSVLTGDTDTSTYGSNTYANINDFKIYVRRTQNGSSSSFTWRAQGSQSFTDGIADAAYIYFARYSYDSDAIERGTDSTRT